MKSKAVFDGVAALLFLRIDRARIHAVMAHTTAERTHIVRNHSAPWRVTGRISTPAREARYWCVKNRASTSVSIIEIAAKASDIAATLIITTTDAVFLITELIPAVD